MVSLQLLFVVSITMCLFKITGA